MKKLIDPLLSAVVLTAISACGGGEIVPVDLSIVPNPVSVLGCGKSVNIQENPAVKTRINKKMGAEEYYLDTHKGRIEITAGSEAGVFWARQTLA